jgi:hypothetical protein
MMRLLDRMLDLVLGEELAPEEAPPLPEGVTVRRGRWIPRLGGLLGRMNGPAAAVTLRRTIVVHPSVRMTQRLLAHEMAHVRQWAEDPLFPLRYTAETLRRGYVQNRYEREAREAEASPNQP